MRSTGFATCTAPHHGSGADGVDVVVAQADDAHLGLPVGHQPREVLQVRGGQVRDGAVVRDVLRRRRRGSTRHHKQQHRLDKDETRSHVIGSRYMADQWASCKAAHNPTGVLGGQCLGRSMLKNMDRITTLWNPMTMWWMAGENTHSIMNAARMASTGHRFFRRPRPCPIPPSVR
jgi:hypothetical protein